MNSIQIIKPEQYPYLLGQIPDLPQQMYLRGNLPSDNHIFLTVVGSRKFTDYGKLACENLIMGLRGLPIVIISGLAYGIDGIAHEAALKAGLKTIAVPGSGISDEMIYPAANKYLAEKILASGGALLSPFGETVFGNKWTFPFRNRIMAGLAHATLVIEADLPSGTLITSKHAQEFNREVCAVPGSIFSKKSEGPHMLIRNGATPITCARDLIDALGLEKVAEKRVIDYSALTPDEMRVIEILSEPLSRELLVEKLGMPISQASVVISMLEIKGLIEEKLGELKRF